MWDGLLIDGSLGAPPGDRKTDEPVDDGEDKATRNSSDRARHPTPVTSERAYPDGERSEEDREVPFPVTTLALAAASNGHDNLAHERPQEDQRGDDEGDSHCPRLPGEPSCRCWQ